MTSGQFAGWKIVLTVYFFKLNCFKLIDDFIITMYFHQSDQFVTELCTVVTDFCTVVTDFCTVVTDFCTAVWD
jgi:hypothetical protein